MKILIAILALVSLPVFAEDKPCLIVQSIAGNRLGSLAAGGVVGIALGHGERYPYLESRNLKVKDVKDHYNKKDLEKLEASGVKVIITNSAQRRRGDVSVSTESQGVDADLAAARRSCEAK